MNVSRPDLYSYEITALRKARALLTITGSGVKALVVSVAVVVLGVVVEGAIKYEVQPRSSKASRTSDAQAR